MGQYQENVSGHNTVPVFSNVRFLYAPGAKPVFQNTELETEDLSFWQRRALDLRLTTTMAPSTQKPYWNTTMVTAWVAVIVGFFTIMASIGGLYLYTDSVAEQRGIEKGRQEVEQRQLRERLDKAEEELRRKKDLELIRSGQQAGHEPKEK